MSGSVLIADGMRTRARRIREACSTRGFATVLVGNGAAALESALADVPAVVIAPVDLELISGPKLAEILRANPRTQDVRFLLIGRLSQTSSEAAHVDETLSPATEPDEVALRVEVLLTQRARVEAAWRQAESDHEVQGRLAQIPLTDLLQLFHLNHRTGTIEVSRREPGGREEHGTLWVRDGSVVQAATGRVEAEKALYRLLAWQDGSFAFSPGPVEMEPRIVTPTRVLLMEGLRQLDEWDRLRSSLPPLDSEIVLHVPTSQLPNVVHPLTQEVLVLLEMHHTVQEVVDYCSHPDYQVLRTLQTLLERDLVRIRHSAPAPRRRSADEVFSSTQARRLRDWLQGSRPRGRAPRDAKLLLIAPDAHCTRDFVRLLAGLPGMRLEEPFRSGQGSADALQVVGQLSVDGDHALEMIHLPAAPEFAPLWPVAAHGALGCLVLLAEPLDEAEAALRPLLEALRAVPRSRIFHVVLLRKGERLQPEGLSARMALLDESSLFLLSLEGDTDPAPLLQTMLGRVIPVSADHLKQFAIFSTLDETERDIVDELLESVELGAGDTLFDEGRESEGLVLVAQGALRIASGRRAGPATLGPGSSIGALSLIAVGTREVEATAAEPTRVLLLSRSAFRRLVDDAPRAGCRLLESVLAETAGLLRGQLANLAASDGPRSA